MESSDNFQEFDAGDIKCDPKFFEAGAGTYGNVVFGHARTLHKPVAVKVFRVTGGIHQKESMEKMIKEEMVHLQKANSDNVVRVLGYVKWSFAMGIVMEYCRGGSLQELILSRDIDLSLSPRLRMLVETAKGIKVCHNLPDKRLIHADLKPGNILLTEKLHCKVGDFGSAEMVTRSGSATVTSLALSQKERPQFTSHYTAPEKLRNLYMKPTKELDIYAFAIVIYEVLTREAPYPPGDQKELLDLIKQGKRPDCSKVHEWMQTLKGDDRETMEELVQLMKGCWDQDPSKRPTMDGVVEDLQQLISRQDEAKLQQEIENVRKQLKLDIPLRLNERNLVPLHQFSSHWGCFLTEAYRSEITRESSTVSTEPPADNAKATAEGDDRDGDNGRVVKRWIAVLTIAVLSIASGRSILLSSENNKKITLRKFSGENPVEKQLNEFSNLLKLERYDEANQVKQEVFRMVEQDVDTTAYELLITGKQQTLNKEYYKAILFYWIAADLFETDPEIKHAADGIRFCVKGLNDAIKASDEDTDWFPGYKTHRIARNYVIPLMRDMRARVKKFPSSDEEHLCLCEVWCLHYIEQSQSIIGDHSSRETTILEALQLMENKFGNKMSKYELYGALLNTLGVVCSRDQSRLQEAKKYIEQAIEAFAKAEDITEQQKNVQMKTSRQGIKSVEEKLQAKHN